MRDAITGSRRRWLILFVLFVARTAMEFQYQTIGSAAPALIRDLGINFAELGTLIGLYHVTGVFLSLPSGIILRWVGDKTLCATGLALMAAGGLVVAEAHGYPVAFAGRLSSSVGVILFNLVMTKMTADWFARREIVLAMAVILSTWPFGIALGLFLQPMLTVLFGWRWMMLLAACVCLFSLLLVTLCYRAPAEERAAETTPATAAVPGAGLLGSGVLPSVITAGVMWGTFNAGLVSYFSFVPTFLAEHGGMTVAHGGALVSSGALGRHGLDPAGRVCRAMERPPERDGVDLLCRGVIGPGLARRRRTARVGVRRARSGHRPTARRDYRATDAHPGTGGSSGRLRRVLHLPLPVPGQRAGHRRLAERRRRQ